MRHRQAILVLCLLNPFPWIEIAHFGFFDVLVGIACAVAVHAARRGDDRLAGVLVGVGVLVKFLPVVILPVLACGRRRLRFDLAGAAAVVVLAGMAASLAVWGPSTFDPVRFAAGRPPVMSIYDLLGSPDSPFQLGLWFDLSGLEKPLIVGSEAMLLVWCWWRKAGPAVSALLAVLVILLFYRSGYNNYQMMAFCLLTYAFAAATDEFRMTRGLLLAILAYLGCLAAIDAGFPVIRRITSSGAATLYLDGCYLARWLARSSPRHARAPPTIIPARTLAPPYHQPPPHRPCCKAGSAGGSGIRSQCIHRAFRGCASAVRSARPMPHASSR